MAAATTGASAAILAAKDAAAKAPTLSLSFVQRAKASVAFAFSPTADLSSTATDDGAGGSPMKRNRAWASAIAEAAGSGGGGGGWGHGLLHEWEFSLMGSHQDPSFLEAPAFGFVHTSNREPSSVNYLRDPQYSSASRVMASSSTPSWLASAHTSSAPAASLMSGEASGSSHSRLVHRYGPHVRAGDQDHFPKHNSHCRSSAGGLGRASGSPFLASRPLPGGALPRGGVSASAVEASVLRQQLRALGGIGLGGTSLPPYSRSTGMTGSSTGVYFRGPAVTDSSASASRAGGRAWRGL